MLFFATVSLWSGTDLHLNQNDALETHGLSVRLFHNQYHKVFGDQKMSGLEIILHDQRVATNGDVRLSATPAQWDPIRHVEGRKRGPLADEITALCRYPDRGLKYRIDVRPEPGGFRIAVQLDEPMLVDLAGKAALNLEFVPDLYFGKSFVTGATAGIFPRHSDGPMERTSDGSLEPAPLAKGDSMLLSPEDPLTRVSINSETGPILLYDGRNQAQNGWFVLRTLLPTGKTVDVIVCHIKVKVGPGWTRSPVIGYNQVGYTPEREKVVIIEPDPLFNAPMAARVLRLTPEGDWREVSTGPVRRWGKWMRYDYASFDFSGVREPGVYEIEYAGERSAPFRIAPNAYEGIWNLSLNTYLTEQMDHVRVRESYRASHLDDARQAPVNYTHFDGHKQGPTTDSPFSAGQDLTIAREEFGETSDDTTVDETARLVQMRRPDGIPDVIQQIEHGVLLLLAEYHAIGHAIPGIIEPTLDDYTFSGDAASKTDGRIYSERIAPRETDGIHSRIPDDRWAFTTHTTALNNSVWRSGRNRCPRASSHER